MSESKPVAAVTGAGSGIGRATALLLAQRGYRLVLAGRRVSKLKETGAACERGGMAGDDWLAVTTDVAQASDCRQMVDMAVSRFGRLDALVNNAGYAPLIPIGQTDPETVRQVFDVNALGTGFAIVAAWPVFQQQRSGCVVNVSTMGTADPFPGFFAYASAKCAVESMARSCAKEGAEIGVRAFAVAPGAVDTEMLRAIVTPEQLPLDQRLAPDDVARVIVACVAGERDEENGGVIRLSAGAS